MKNFNDTMIVFGYVFMIAVLISFFYNPIFDILAQNKIYLLILFIAFCTASFFKRKH